VVLTWQESAPHGRSALELAVRETDGTWGEPATVAQRVSFLVNWADVPSLSELPSGGWLVHWLQKTGPTSYAYHVMLASGADRGKTWSRPFSPHRDRSSTEPGFVSMVPWGVGAGVVWLDGRAMLSGVPAALAQERPASVPRLQDTMAVVLEGGVRDSVFPGAIAVVGNRHQVLAQVAVGHLDWEPSPPPTDSTLWDLASLTKVVALTTAMMQLWERGLLDLEAPVQRYLPEFAGPGKDRVTVRHLLTHSSGLPAWRPLYLEAPTPDSALALVFATPLEAPPGTRMVYSDLGAILLGQIVVRLSGERFDQYVQSHVVTPLSLRDTQFRPPRALWDRVAPTEVDTAWRKRHLRGEVHDENAYALGGVSSHAGLFSSARDLARFARLLLNGGTLDGVAIVRPETIARFTRLDEPALSHRALGWEKPNGTNSAGHRLSPAAFGHTGFTGTSLWVDPAKDVFILLLSNRVNPTRLKTGIAAVRVALADAVMAVIEGQTR
jgi:CubicO group peptidase (beta-lactamase class C family)